MSKLTILVDSNSLGFAALHSQKLSSGSLPTGAIYGFIRSIQKLKKEYPHAEILCLWDCRANWRFDMLPSYKESRNADPKRVAEKKIYQDQVPVIKLALTLLGVTQMWADELEADDLAGILTKRFSRNPEDEVLLITGDQDWLQLVRENVSWRDLRDDTRKVTFRNFTNYTGYKTPHAFLHGKALQGDSSDCIPGVGGIGEKGASLFLAEHGSVIRFRDRVASGEIEPKTKAERLLLGKSEFTKEQWAEKFDWSFPRPSEETVDQHDKAKDKAFKAHMEKYEGNGWFNFGRNILLMQLMTPKKPTASQTTIIKGDFDRDAFAELCAELTFMSILRDLDSFLKPFSTSTVTK